MRTRGPWRGPLGPQRSWRSPSPSPTFRPPSGRRSSRTEGAHAHLRAAVGGKGVSHARASGRAAAEARGSGALAFFRARVIAADGRGTLERSGALTPYVLEEIAENARRAGSVWLEVAPRGDEPGLSAVWEECARLAARGISVNFRLV